MPTFVKAYHKVTKAGKSVLVKASSRTGHEQYHHLKKQLMALRKKGDRTSPSYKNMKAQKAKLGKSLGYHL